MAVALRSKLGLVVEPVYLRKIDRRSDWGDASDEMFSRASHAESAIFSAEDTFSLFFASTDEELSEVVVGMNSGRSSPTQQIDFVGFTQTELDLARIRLTGTQGDTMCDAANSLHVDAIPRDGDSFRFLCLSVFASQREPFRISKSEAAEMLDDMRRRGCKAVAQPPSCECVK